MSEEIKMSEAFALPVTGCKVDMQGASEWVDEFMIIDNPEGFDKPMDMQAKYTAHAINNHDRLTEENRKLREALKLITDQSEKYTAKTKGKGVKVREIREYDLLSAKQMLEEL